MVRHCIITGSSYQKGTRIAFHYPLTNGVLSLNEFKIIYEKLIERKNLSHSFHVVVTDSVSWESIVSYDSFFENILVIKTIDEFILLLEEDKIITGLDVAKYILARVSSCTHLQLEKLVYMCYADYLCKYKQKLFSDRIYAFDMGPVIDSVYAKYKGCKEIKHSYSEAVTQSRFMVLDDVFQKLRSIDETLEKYKKYDGYALMDITHHSASPWSFVYTPNSFHKEIPDEVILKRHCYEVV